MITGELVGQALPRYDGDKGAVLEWSVVEDNLGRGGWCWISTVRPDGSPHTVPVYAALDLDGPTLFVAANARTRKARNLSTEPRCVVAKDAGDMHIVVEGDAVLVEDLKHASAVFAERYGWPTTVTPEGLDAPYGSPTSLGPPFEVWAIRPHTVFVFPTDSETFAPTRFVRG